MKKIRNFIREKKIYCGTEFLEVDIIPRIEQERIRTGRRSKKEKISAPKQKNLNDKNARRYFVQLINSNFTQGDIHTTITYKKEFLPDTVEAAEKQAANYLRRIAYRRKKEGLPPLKYILVTEYAMGRDKEKPVRIHHHIIMNAGLDRDTVEDIWCRPKQKGKKERDKIGFANTDRLQPNEFGFEALARYLMKNQQKGKKRWSSSQNLVKPWSRTNDHKYSRREVEKLIKSPDDNEFWGKKYPGWTLTECKPDYNEITGWAIYLKMRRLKE